MSHNDCLRQMTFCRLQQTKDVQIHSGQIQETPESQRHSVNQSVAQSGTEYISVNKCST